MSRVDESYIIFDFHLYLIFIHAFMRRQKYHSPLLLSITYRTRIRE